MLAQFWFKTFYVPWTGLILRENVFSTVVFPVFMLELLATATSL